MRKQDEIGSKKEQKSQLPALLFEKGLSLDENEETEKENGRDADPALLT